jgi:hypothetical protein
MTSCQVLFPVKLNSHGGGKRRSGGRMEEADSTRQAPAAAAGGFHSDQIVSTAVCCIANRFCSSRPGALTEQLRAGQQYGRRR